MFSFLSYHPLSREEAVQEVLRTVNQNCTPPAATTTTNQPSQTSPLTNIMSNHWETLTRLPNHRLHPTREEALACGHSKEKKHFDHLPEYPPLRKKCTARRAAGKGYRRPSVETVDGEEDNIIVRQSSSSQDWPAFERSSPGRSSCGNTPAFANSSPASSPPPAYPAPLTQQKTLEDESEAGVNDVDPIRRRLDMSAATSARTATPISFVAETPLPGLSSSSALPGVVQSIETDDIAHAPSQASASGSSSAVIPATIFSENNDREETPKTQLMNQLRGLLDNNNENLRDSIFLNHRLQTRNEIDRLSREVAEAKAQEAEVKRYGTEAQLQLAREETDAVVRKLEEAKTQTKPLNAKQFAGDAAAFLVLLVAVVYAFWGKVNGADFEYIEKRRRELFGLKAKK
jgi:hypothetical protein